MTTDADGGTSRDPADGSLVEREGVNAGSAQGEEPDGARDAPSLAVGSTTGRGEDLGGDRIEEPSQVWADGSGVADPGAAYATESGQDEGLLG